VDADIALSAATATQQGSTKRTRAALLFMDLPPPIISRRYSYGSAAANHLATTVAVESAVAQHKSGKPQMVHLEYLEWHQHVGCGSATAGTTQLCT
jgi:hypothetical protein